LLKTERAICPCKEWNTDLTNEKDASWLYEKISNKLLELLKGVNK
jgi:hypothetical protein